ncbi:ATP-binding protein [Xylophilus sp.]|uniref:ATP-binding protein n=1 Tax=Xylophilus sp. TaxID=2653893 RepID=UPI0013BE66C2|nr:sensor histidine kinase [Xylophilus sp.]KAF1048766.1 MAG: Sensor protein TorS [Xylophilus sp.]
MKRHPLVTARITGAGLINVRDRTRQLAGSFQLDQLQATRLITAVSEIARNAVEYAGGGTATFFFEEPARREGPQYLVVQIADKGPGIADVEAVLAGGPARRGRAPVGLAGARRLVDGFLVESAAGQNTTVTLKTVIPRIAGRFDPARLPQLVEELVRQRPASALEELERQNREMLSTLEELRLRQLELERADERKNHFLAVLAHELRTPLGTLQLMLEIIARNPNLSADELDQRRRLMARQTEQMTKLVSDLIDVSRVSQGKVDLVRVPLELNELVAQSLEIAQGAVTGRRHTLTVQRSPGDLWTLGDATRLRQVLVNLVQNAARYTPEGGRIAVRLSREGHRALIEVADNGSGIEPDVLPHIFDLFVQGHPGAVEGHSGLGIGLTLVRRLVAEHGGIVTASSLGPGQGSLFTVSLPLESA